MKKKMIHLFLIIVCLGSLFLVTGWHQHHKKSHAPKLDRTIALNSPQSVTQFLKSNF